MITERLAAEPDREFFLDHGRRNLRFRSPQADEPEGWGILVHRDGRRFGWPVSGASAFEVNANPRALEIMFEAVSQSPGLMMEAATIAPTIAAA